MEWRSLGVSKRHEIRGVMSNQGFTLLELVVAMAIVGIIMAGVYATYFSQQKSYLVQDQVAAMQQNLRAGMFYMEREIRMAGLDPTGTTDSGVITATANSVNFTMDFDGDGGIGADEDITYSLKDSNGDGTNDHLDRNNQIVAENIDALDFVYLDETGNVLDDDGSGNVVASIPLIRSIQLSLLARTGRGDRGFTNNKTYFSLQGAPIYTAPGDSFRRRLLTTEIKSRNLEFGP
jgi:type IV pilus assembly protein PilW